MSKRLVIFWIALFFAISCKPRATPSESQLASSSTTSCSNALIKSQDKALVKEIAEIQKDYFSGKISLVSQRAQIDRVVQAGGGLKSGAGLAASKTLEASAASIVIPAALEFDPDLDLSPALIYALRGVGVDPVFAYAYVAMMHERLKAPAAALIAEGAAYDAEKGWQLTNVKLNAEQVKKNSKLRTAIAYFFSPQILTSVEDETRSEAIFAGNFVLLPPDAEGHIATTSRSEWDETTERYLSMFKRDAETFIRATRQANTYGNLMKGRLVQIFGGERGHEGKTAPEIEAESSYKGLVHAINKLRAQGVGEKLRTQLVTAQKILVDLEGESIKEGLSKLDSAQKAAIAVPFIPIAIWVAPYAGALMGPQWAPVIANAATTAAAMPLAFSVGSVAVSTTLHIAAGNTEYACDAYEQFVTRASGGLYAAAYAAWTPVIVATTAGTAAIAIPGAPAAATTYGVINLALASKSLVGMISSGVTGAKECLSEIEKVKGSASVSLDTVNAAAGEALETCVTAGIDLGFAIVSTANFTAEAYEALSKGEVSDQLAEQCSLGLTAKSCGKKPKKTEEGGDNISPEEMVEHYGKKMPYDTEEHKALLAYGAEEYKNINSALREGGRLDGRTKVGKYIKEIDEAMVKAKPLPEGTVLYRGKRVKANTKPHKTGDVIEFDSYTSTSINPEIANRFAFGLATGAAPGTEPMEYIIEIPKGQSQKAVYMEQVPGIAYPGEQEILLPRDTKLKVLKVKTENRLIYGAKLKIQVVYAQLTQ
jgi:hypothetical protein